jgi:nucleotide-binding universal stress UspA family protein
MTVSHAAAKPVVVGVDGSPGSREALHWGVRQAQLTKCPVRAVIAWRWPIEYGNVPPAIEVDLRVDSAETLSAMVDEVLQEFPDVHLEQVVREGRSAAVLLEEAAGASLLVVGNRGHGAFTGMLLGSVSVHCVANADCPVTVVRNSGAE